MANFINAIDYVSVDSCSVVNIKQHQCSSRLLMLPNDQPHYSSQYTLFIVSIQLAYSDWLMGLWSQYRSFAVIATQADWINANRCSLIGLIQAHPLCYAVCACFLYNQLQCDAYTINNNEKVYAVMLCCACDNCCICG